MSRLLVAVLGNRQSGKSTTWNTLFGQTVRTGRHARELDLGGRNCVTVFLVSGSPEERGKDVEEILRQGTPDIVLSSVQYAAGAQDTFQFFFDNDYRAIIHWLNPGYSDGGYQPDHLGLVEWLQHQRSMIGLRDGTAKADSRVREVRSFIHGWAAQRGLLHPCP